MKLAFTTLQNIKGNILKTIADPNNYAEEAMLIGQNRKRFDYMLIRVRGYPCDIETDLYIQVNINSENVQIKYWADGPMFGDDTTERVIKWQEFDPTIMKDIVRGTFERQTVMS